MPLLMLLNIANCLLSTYILLLGRIRQNPKSSDMMLLVSHCYPTLPCMVFCRTCFYHRFVVLSSQPPAPPEKTTSSQISVMFLDPVPIRSHQNPGQLLQLLLAAYLPSRLENLIFNKSNKREVLSMRKSGDNDLLLLLLFPAQMVLQMKWIKVGSSLWLVTGADLALPVGSHQTHSTLLVQELPTGMCTVAIPKTVK